jgi:hypothetical protein
MYIERDRGFRACNIRSTVKWKYKGLQVAVFGGSTSTGSGTAKPSKMAWPVVFGHELENKINMKVKVDNFAKGARTANYFSTCFNRFLQGPLYDIILLEFAINGGDVTALVDEISHYSPQSKIVLVKQLSCRSHSGSIDLHPIQGGYVNTAWAQTKAALQRALVELDFVNYLTGIYGNPCSSENQNILFDEREKLNPTVNPGRHHLGLFGSQLLGQFVAKQVYDLMVEHRLDNPRNQSIGALKGQNLGQNIEESISCMFAGLLNTCSPNQKTCAIHDAFTSIGWIFNDTIERNSRNIPREDKVCWITNTTNSTLTLKWNVSFSTISIFIEFSNRYDGQIGIFCNHRMIQAIDLFWGGPFTLVEIKRVFGNCTNETLVIKNLSAHTAKICGIVIG